MYWQLSLYPFAHLQCHSGAGPCSLPAELSARTRAEPGLGRPPRAALNGARSRVVIPFAGRSPFAPRKATNGTPTRSRRGLPGWPAGAAACPLPARGGQGSTGCRPRSAGTGTPPAPVVRKRNKGCPPSSGGHSSRTKWSADSHNTLGKKRPGPRPPLLPSPTRGEGRFSAAASRTRTVSTGSYSEPNRHLWEKT